MTDKKNPGETLTVTPTKTLTLKRTGVEQGVVRQSFSHGRTKQVVVEKVKRRMVGPGEAKAEPAPAAAAPQPRRAPMPSGRAAPASSAPAPAGKPSGVVLRTLTEEERSARAHALADAKVREAEERRIAEEEAHRRAERDSRERVEREAAEARKREEERPPPSRGRGQAQGRNRGQEAVRRGREGEVRRDLHHPRRSAVGAPQPQRRPGAGRGRGAARREAARWRGTAPGACAEAEPVRSAEAARPSDRGDGVQCRRGARAFRGVVPPPDAAPDQRARRERGEGQARTRGDDPGGDHHPGTRQPHGGARGRRDQAADEAGADAQDHRHDRCRHRAADRRGARPQRAPRRRIRRRGRPVRQGR